MLNQSSLQKIKKDLESFDRTRETVIKNSRDILKHSKKAVYCVHRNEKAQAESLINKAKKDIEKINALAKNDTDVESIGAFLDALEEYVEACCFFNHTYTHNIPTNTELRVNGEMYLRGLSDFTGELVRKAVRLATLKKYGEVFKIRDLIEEIYGFFLELNLRNGTLRKKVDSIKWNLQKIEDIVYNINMKK